jgi:aryl-alcohol dehydrogenase-like predicted oxidoreductase
MQKRPYGRDGVALSIVGFGAITIKDLEQSRANAIVRDAFDRGINYFDVAPSYGNAEEKLGPAIEAIRDDIFLACKTGQRTRDGAQAEIENSLRRLKTDRFDLYQLHALTSIDDVETALGPGGAMEAILAARDKGIIRYVGFSAHSTEAALLALEMFPFDSVLFPFNVTSYRVGKFGPEVLEAAQKAGASRLALKPMARTHWAENADRSAHPNCWYEPYTQKDQAERAWRWTLSLPITAAIPPGDPALFAWALEFAERFAPLTDDEQTALEAIAPEHGPLFPLA